MENRVPEPVPFIVHEGMVARQERTIKRLWILCLVIFAAFVGSNAAWIWYESQFEEQEIVQTVLQDSDDGGTNTYHGNIIGGDLNGETSSDYESEKESP